MIATPLRPRIELEDGWEFIRTRVGRSWLKGLGGDGQSVTLPHCWNASDTFQYGRTSYSGWAAYRRQGTIPMTAADGMSWNLRLGGFYGVGDVWLDGRRLAKINGQYLGEAVALPAPIEGSEHLLALRLDNRWRRNVLPGFRQPDFILHGGLAGGVWLEGLPDHRFDIDRVRIECRKGENNTERVSISWAVAGPGTAGGDISVGWTVIDGEGHAVAPEQTWRGHLDHQQQSTTIAVPDPRCWSPEDPALYWAEGRLVIDGDAVDIVRIRFGVTRAEFLPRRGFFLDGVRVDLHGCNRHEAIPGFGNALPDDLQRRDAVILKELGCNFVRLSHYPQSPAFLDACDEIGLMIYAEIATWKSVRSNQGWRKAARRQMSHMVARDRHHPSIVVWGMGNESRSRKAYLELRATVRELDPRRPVTYAENHIHRARRQRTVGIPDVWGVNYELDAIDEACTASRLKNVLVSECCNYPDSVYGDDRKELIQVATLERDWEVFADRPDVAGHTVWSFTDYATEHRKRFRRLSGLCNAWRRPKMAAALFRARFSTEPFVALFVTRPGPEPSPSRFRLEHRSDGEGLAPRELHAFTNCDTLRLARDGSMHAVLEGAIHHVLPLFGTFDEIIATGSQNGNVVQDRVRRSGEAQRVHLRTATDASAPTVEVEIEILDNSSIVVDDWSGTVHLSLEGPGRLHAFNVDSEAEVIRGTGRVYVTVDSRSEGIVVTASAPGLSPAILSLHAG